jgi:hypothetical protein
MGDSPRTGCHEETSPPATQAARATRRDDVALLEARADRKARERAKRIMKGFDKLPRKERDKQNYSEPLPRPVRQTSKSVKRWCTK